MYNKAKCPQCWRPLIFLSAKKRYGCLFCNYINEESDFQVELNSGLEDPILI